MSLEIIGNNNYENIPLIDTNAGTWAEGIYRCDPLFRDLAAVGLSALVHGVEQSQHSDDPLGAVEYGELFDDSDKFVGAVPRESSPRPQYVDHFVAGVHVTTAALAASRLFRALDVINDDYVGQTGMRFVQRRTELPVVQGMSRDAGRTINTYPVRTIQARVFREKSSSERPRTELDFAAALLGAGSLPSSTTMTLMGGVDFRRQTVQANVVSGERQGDFVRGYLHSDFKVLSRYAKVVHDNLDNL